MKLVNKLNVVDFRTEKNAQGWSKDYMKELLVGTSLNTSVGEFCSV